MILTAVIWMPECRISASSGQEILSWLMSELKRILETGC
jgi:hypothetical protein